MKIEGLQIQSRMTSHLAMSTYHLMLREHTLIAPGNLINGRKFYSEVKTSKSKNGNFGKSKSYFYFSDTPKNEEFNTIEDLLKSINIEIN